MIVLKEITELDQKLSYIVHNGQKTKDLSKIFGLKYARIDLVLVIMMRLYNKEHLEPSETTYFGIAY